MVLRNGDRTISVGLDSYEGKGAQKNFGVYVGDEHGEIINGSGLAGSAVPSHHICGFRDPPDIRRRLCNFEEILTLSCSERGKEQRGKKGLK